ncbi:flagellar hook-associated protein FlgK [Serpentinicella sp. ANB-PHB4]|uniref:flagellar hook-associated protein FlgK n=1 Tax=Serpentinicella sp. ANB-PHB4 TaxID=3074076 RepID=UPI00285B779F|nr:flagellar hook-associated protein FlgK [Serpentinicella sp. ANB-PHB4]MDR5659771.1 flagellar hook-associated protein FlgK [Serpentinicella sp. ANB-PHB4]
MRSTFLGFNTARSGLFAAQRSLDTTGHNIANVNTPGYTRQRLEQKSSTPLALPGREGMLGTGVTTVTIEQVRNEFLDFKYRKEVNASSEWEARRDGLMHIEAIMNEPSDTGINTVIDEFFQSLQELNKNPQELTNRSLVRQRGVALSNSLNHMHGQMERMIKDTNEDVITTVRAINSYANQIARLNEKIFSSEVGGSNANDLRDQRNLLIDELSELVDVEVIDVVDPNSKGENKATKMAIQINGQPLVSHDKVNRLSTEDEVKHDHIEDLYINKVKWENGSGFDSNSINGNLRGLLDLRDGNGKEGQYGGLPYYMEELDRFAQTFAKKFNEIHASGYDINGGTDTLFFTANGTASSAMIDGNGNIEHDKITAKNIAVSLDLQDLNKFAAATNKELLPGDGSNILKLIDLRQDTGMFKEGAPEDYIKSLVAALGVDTQEAIRNTQNQEFLTEQLDNQRQAVSGVSMDEELSKMVMFQHAYNASARMVNTMDEMLDVIINRLGQVGR